MMSLYIGLVALTIVSSMPIYIFDKSRLCKFFSKKPKNRPDWTILGVGETLGEGYMLFYIYKRDFTERKGRYIHLANFHQFGQKLREFEGFSQRFSGF